MRASRAVEPWLLDPLERFVAETGTRLTLIMTPAGQVLAQYGFTRAVDVMAAAALGAGIVASTGELARMLAEKEFQALNHQGARHGIFLAAFETRRGRLLALVVYGTDSSFGLVQLFFEDLVIQLVTAAPAPQSQKAVLAADFEKDLNESLSTLFR
jgi:hypothetical protein